MKRGKDILEDNLEKNAPLLNGIPKSNPFTVPEGYFDVLPAQIMAKCRENVSSPSLQGMKPDGQSLVYNKIFWLFKPQWMLATFIAIAGIILFLRRGYNTPADYQTIASALPDSVIMANLQNNIDYVDVNMLEDMAQKQGVFSADMLYETPFEKDATNKQIINYLINNNIDLSDVENEL